MEEEHGADLPSGEDLLRNGMFFLRALEHYMNRDIDLIGLQIYCDYCEMNIDSDFPCVADGVGHDMCLECVLKHARPFCENQTEQVAKDFLMNNTQIGGIILPCMEFRIDASSNLVDDLYFMNYNFNLNT